MDDVIVFGANKEEHEARLTATLRQIEAAGVTLNPRKCEFRKTSMKFLGHVVAGDGIRPDPDKTAAIQNMQAPTNMPELSRFLGMTNQILTTIRRDDATTSRAPHCQQSVGVGP